MWEESGSTAGKAAAAWESGSCPVSQPQTGNLRNRRISLG